MGFHLSEGYHTIHIVDREDGYIVDRIMLAMDKSDFPSGSENGPDESQREAMVVP